MEKKIIQQDKLLNLVITESSRNVYIREYSADGIGIAVEKDKIAKLIEILSKVMSDKTEAI